MAIYRAKELQVATAIADEDPEIRLRNNFQSKVALLDSIVVHYYLIVSFSTYETPADQIAVEDTNLHGQGFDGPVNQV